MAESILSPEVLTWKQRNPEKVAEGKRRWYQKHKAEIAAKTAARHALNPEKKRARNARWRAENADHKKEYQEKYHQANKGAHKARNANRRAKQAGNKLSPGLEKRLFRLQKGKCACCGLALGDDFHMDHVMPLALGGSNTDDNMQLLRSVCNLQKHARHPVEYMQSKGFLL